MKSNIDQYSYTITLVTPAGIRQGNLLLNINQKDISGYLDVLNHRNSITGKLLESGQCEITGKLISLMRKSKYTATGKFDSQSIQLTLKGQMSSYQLYGIKKTGGLNDGLYRNEK